MSISQAELADRDKPMHLEANQLSIDDAKQISVFEGKVKLTQGTMIINADKIVVVQDKEGFKHGTATGHPASFRQKRDGLNEYVEGYGERIEYDTKTETWTSSCRRASNGIRMRCVVNTSPTTQRRKFSK